MAGDCLPSADTDVTRFGGCQMGSACSRCAASDRKDCGIDARRSEPGEAEAALEAALAHFNSALELRPGYKRPLLGRIQVIFLGAIGEECESGADMAELERPERTSSASHGTDRTHSIWSTRRHSEPADFVTVSGSLQIRATTSWA